MKFLIISDIHAMSKDLLDLTECTNAKNGQEKRGGYSGSTRGNVMVEELSNRKNRLLAIPKFLKSAGYDSEIDCLICLGDIAHQCKKSVMQIVWRQLHDLKDELGIGKLFAVTGNHDVAARDIDFSNGPPDKALRLLKPEYPSTEIEKNRDYRTEGFSLTEIGKLGLLTIDTSSLIGYTGKNQSELWNRGYIGDEMLESIEQCLSQSTCSGFLIAMHHHPAPVHPEFDKETDYIENGEELLRLVGETGKPSFLLHGHKHFVNFRKHSGNGNTPWIFSASSLAAKPYPNFEENYSCQFHILDITFDDSGKSLKGQIKSWDWIATKWEKATSKGMLHLVGFGKKNSIEEIGRQVYERVRDGGTLSGKAAFANIPDLMHLTIDEKKQLETKLSEDHSVRMITDGGIETYSFFVEE